VNEAQRNTIMARKDTKIVVVRPLAAVLAELDAAIAAK